MSLQRSILQRGNQRSSVLSGKFTCLNAKTNHRPSTSETEDIIKLFDAGMACARFNFSHGTAKVSITSCIY